MVSRVPPSAGVSWNVTSSELPSPATSPAGWVQRKENLRGGSTSTTVKPTVPPPASGSPKTISPSEPGVGSYRASSGHHSRRCSGLLTTWKTISGDASMWTSRSMVPNSMAASCNVWLQMTLTTWVVSRNPWLLRSLGCSAVVAHQAERMAGRVEQHPDVVLRLRLGQRGAQGDRVLDRRVEVADLEVEVHHRPLLPRRRRPHRGLVTGRLLEHHVDRPLRGGQDRRPRLLVADRPVEQLGVEPRQGRRVGRLDGGSPPHAAHPRSHGVQRAGSPPALSMTALVGTGTPPGR